MGYTIRDIAAACGVNPSTVSRALRNDPRVKPATRDAIMALAGEYGYTPNISARNLAAGKTDTIWFFLSSLKNEIEQKPAVGLSSLIQEQGYDLMLVLHRGQQEHFIRLLRKLTQKITDAAVILPPHLDDKTELEVKGILSSANIPVVFIDRWFTSLDYPVVTTDNEFSVRSLTEKCLDSGAEFFFLNFPDRNPVSMARKKAAADFLRARGIAFYDENNFNAGVLLNHSGKALGVLASTGNICTKLLDERCGALLTERIVYGGFFDSWTTPFREFYRRIFICRQDFAQIAAQASELIIAMLGGQSPAPGTIIRVPPEKFIEI